MHEYEIRILRASGVAAVIIEEVHLCDSAAIKSARRMALGKQFEVWRDLDCITGPGKLPGSGGL